MPRTSIKIAALLLGLISASAQAISLSTYRIYLDTENNSASFIMFNKSAVTETCALSLVHNDFTKDGKLVPYQGAGLPENSAEPWMRYSPRNFVVAPQNPQTIRFTMRRKSNMQAAEYRSYLRVSCDEVAPKVDTTTSGADNVAKLSIKPKIVQNIPIIVRTGKLDASLEFGDFALNEEKLEFTIARKGDRSVYGTLELINKNNGDVVVFRRNISIYTEVEKVSYSLVTAGLPTEQLMLRFTEDSAYGGTITHTQDVVIK
ncbi:hypothetical protein [Paraglaciecola aestuariivivens]